MTYQINKRLIYKKHHFEEYLNSIESNKFWNDIKVDFSFKTTDNKGSVLRRKDKIEFDRLYLLWLNTK